MYLYLSMNLCLYISIYMSLIDIHFKHLQTSNTPGRPPRLPCHPQIAMSYPCPVLQWHPYSEAPNELVALQPRPPLAEDAQHGQRSAAMEGLRWWGWSPGCDRFKGPNPGDFFLGVL